MAVQAFDVNAVDYVLEAVRQARIAKAIQRARREIESETSPTDRLEKLSVASAPANWSRKPSATAPSKILVNAPAAPFARRCEDMIFATISDGLISIIRRDMEGTSNYRTLDELEDALASDPSGERTAPTRQHPPHQRSCAVVQVHLHAKNERQETKQKSPSAASKQNACGTV